jgi:ADP-ribosyl-[dinitrogen reductase] hydrolase
MTMPILDAKTPHERNAAGAVYGALIGDAAGGVLEFFGRQPTKSDALKALDMPGGGVFDLAPGQFTDDGEMTVTLLNALVSTHGIFDEKTVAQGYRDWAMSDPFDIGIATRSALRGIDSSQNSETMVEGIRRRARENNFKSKANGSLMRATPLGIAACRCTLDETIFIARQDAEFTHPNDTCVASTTAYVLALRHLILSPKDNVGAIDVARSYLSGHNSEVMQWLQDAEAGDLPAATPQAGFVRYGFTYAFHFLYHGFGFKQAILETLVMGGDTDTNACIVGGLLGAYHGLDGIPKGPLAKLIDCNTQKGQSRPDAYTIGPVSSNLEKVLAYCLPTT